MTIEKLQRANEIMSEIREIEAPLIDTHNFNELTKVVLEFNKGLYSNTCYHTEDMPEVLKKAIKSYLDGKKSEDIKRVNQLKKELESL